MVLTSDLLASIGDDMMLTVVILKSTLVKGSCMIYRFQ